MEIHMSTKNLDALYLELSLVVNVKTQKEIDLEAENKRLKEQLFDPTQRDIVVNKLRDSIRSAWVSGCGDWRTQVEKEIFDVIGIKSINDLYI